MPQADAIADHLCELIASTLYAGMSEREVRAHFLPDDGHWNQRGSDKVAAYVSGLLIQ